MSFGTSDLLSAIYVQIDVKPMFVCCCFFIRKRFVYFFFRRVLYRVDVTLRTRQKERAHIICTKSTGMPENWTTRPGKRKCSSAEVGEGEKSRVECKLQGALLTEPTVYVV